MHEFHSTIGLNHGHEHKGLTPMLILKGESCASASPASSVNVNHCQSLCAERKPNVALSSVSVYPQRPGEEGLAERRPKRPRFLFRMALTATGFVLLWSIDIEFFFGVPKTKKAHRLSSSERSW